MTTRCWQQDPVRRPKMAEVVATLREWQVFLPLQCEHFDMLLFIAVVGCPLQHFQEEWRCGS